MTAGRTAGLLGSLVGSLLFLFVVAAPAGAVTFGLDWNGDNGAANLEAVRDSGATTYHAPLAYGDWVGDDALVQAAWERGLTILPTLTRSSPTGSRFLLPTDPEWANWGAWVRQLVERYGPDGTFWLGKANPNPTPITAWEVWNEPNLPENDPLIGEAECAAVGQPFLPAAGTCVQPQSYGTFLAYTAESMQLASQAVSGGPTNILTGGLNLDLGEDFASFLAKAAPYGGLSQSVTGVAIHPYSFADGVAGFTTGVEAVRRYLDEAPNGLSKTLWITELGWPVGGTAGLPGSGAPVSEAEQAEFVTQSIEWIDDAAPVLGVELVAWYNVRDFPSGAHWDGYTGLLREDGTPRPAWYRFRQALRVE
jgi:hypothetical protein